MSSAPRQKRGREPTPTGSPPPGPADCDRSTLTDLEQLPNVGSAVAGYLRLAGVARPLDLVGRDPYAMYDELCRVTGRRLDPCLLDTYLAAIHFMGGQPARPWWSYTAEHKRELQRRRAAQEPG